MFLERLSVEPNIIGVAIEINVLWYIAIVINRKHAFYCPASQRPTFVCFCGFYDFVLRPLGVTLDGSFYLWFSSADL